MPSVENKLASDRSPSRLRTRWWRRRSGGVVYLPSCGGGEVRVPGWRRCGGGGAAGAVVRLAGPSPLRRRPLGRRCGSGEFCWPELCGAFGCLRPPLRRRVRWCDGGLPVRDLEEEKLPGTFSDQDLVARRRATHDAPLKIGRLLSCGKGGGLSSSSPVTASAASSGGRCAVVQRRCAVVVVGVECVVCVLVFWFVRCILI